MGALHLHILQSLSDVASKLPAKVDALLENENLTVQEVSLLMTSLADLQRSFKPLQLIHHEFTTFVHPEQFAYPFDGLIGFEDVTFLVVDGMIVPRSLYSWNADVGLLHLVGDYRIEDGQTAEIYLMA